MEGACVGSINNIKMIAQSTIRTLGTILGRILNDNIHRGRGVVAIRLNS